MPWHHTWLVGNSFFWPMVAFTGGVPCFLCDQAAGCGCPNKVYAGAALDHGGPGEAPQVGSKGLNQQCLRHDMPLTQGCGTGNKLVIDWRTKFFVYKVKFNNSNFFTIRVLL